MVADATQPGSSARAIADSPEKHTFLTREQLKERRDGCDVTRKGPEKTTVSMYGGQLTVRYSLVGGRTCLSAAGADSDWAYVNRWDNGEALVQVEPNDTGATRESVVTLTTAAGKRATYTITQPGEAGAVRAARKGAKQ
ncbi:BACON domain-containing protein [Burkholderia cenocepacia]|uniref:BACON domain-containing protein n=1 Tax=Burkholderia cenocepacia TaxID=95486 RepID=UPI0012377CF6|nr:BACON domain-containing protein [Burkholderia cenocepacia]